MTNTIRRELQLPQSREQVWQAITDSTTLAEWMYPNDFEPRVGHHFTFRVPPNPQANFEGLTVHCEVLECEPPRENAGGRLVFSWTAGGIVDTRVSFQLEPDGAGTRLVFEHAGFDLALPFGEQAFHGAEYGWARMLKQLSVVVANAANQSE
ncbi:SRPBCC domain-containing protein [Anatilimnocola sp. NA78]|uniref:SRPBCC family protein n=1 Tax=Anatilimnocola sp. NA78 TaxID=3415683 RepID=UPI003CE597B9